MQAFPLKQHCPGVFWPIKMHAFFWMYQVESGHLHYTSKKIGSVILITIKVLNIGTDRFDPDLTALNYEQSDQGLHCFAIPTASFTGICIHCN